MSTVRWIAIGYWRINSSLPLSLTLSLVTACGCRVLLTTDELTLCLPGGFRVVYALVLVLVFQLLEGKSDRRLIVCVRRDVPLPLKPGTLKVRRSGRNVTSDAAVMAMPGSMSVQIMALVPVTRGQGLVS